MSGRMSGNSSETQEFVTALTTLLGAYADGDRAALDEVMRRAMPRLRELAAMLLRKRPGVRDLGVTDVIQNGFIAEFAREGITARDREQFYRHLTVAMKSALADHADWLRAAKRGGGVAPQSLDRAPEIAADDPLAVNFDREEVARALEAIAEDHPLGVTLFVMHHHRDFSFRELAAIFGMTVATVRSTIAKAHDALLDRLEGCSTASS